MADDGTNTAFENMGPMTHLVSVMNFPYMPPLRGGMVQVSKAGACDPDMKTILARLVAWRFATAAFRFTRDPVTGNLTILRTQLQLFNQGPGETGSGGFTGALTGSETNAVEQGGLVPSGTRWYTIGSWVSMQAPYTVAVGGDAAGARTYNVNLQNQNGYDKRIARALMDSTYIEVNHGTGNACRYSLGPLGLLVSGVGDGSQAANQNGGVPGTFFWTSTMDESTGKNEDGALRMTVDVTHDITIEQDATNLTTADRDVIIPIKFVLMGFPLCEPNACAPDAADIEARIDRRFGQLMDRMDARLRQLGPGKS